MATPFRIPSPVGLTLTTEAAGYAGGTYFSDTSNHTGNWSVIEAVGDTTFTTLTGNLTNGASISLADGRRLYGQFTVVRLSAGAVIAYNDPVANP